MRCFWITAALFAFLLAAMIGCGGAKEEKLNGTFEVEVKPHKGGGVKIDVDGKPVVDIDLKKE